MPGLVVLAVAMVLAGGLWLLVQMFRKGVWWGLLGLLFPPVQWFFVIVHWREAWRPLLLQLVALAVLVFALLQDPEAGLKHYWQQVSTQFTMLVQQSGMDPSPASGPAELQPESAVSTPRGVQGSRTIHQCRDARGAISFSDQPCDAGAEEVNRQVIRDSAASAKAAASTPNSKPAPAVKRPQFRCDGRTRCTVMTSCEEATFFLENCPGVDMDGDGDGVPCEDEWCGH